MVVAILTSAVVCSIALHSSKVADPVSARRDQHSSSSPKMSCIAALAGRRVQVA